MEEGQQLVDNRPRALTGRNLTEGFVAAPAANRVAEESLQLVGDGAARSPGADRGLARVPQRGPGR